MPRYHHGVRTNANPSVAVTSCSIVALASKFLPHISPNNRRHIRTCAVSSYFRTAGIVNTAAEHVYEARGTLETVAEEDLSFEISP